MYSIRLENRDVGQAQVIRQGLFYHIQCHCTLDTNQMYRIVVNCRGKQVDLGVCVPMGSAFGLSTRIPVKQLGEGELHFSVVPKDLTKSEVFYPISTKEPFANISSLKDAFLVHRAGQIGAVVRIGKSD